MAKEDWTGAVSGADRVIDGGLEAGQVVNRDPVVTPDADAKAFADTNNVSQAAYANYDAALSAHEARADIESLADRRAREVATTFAATDFMRDRAYAADGTAEPAPRPGTVQGNSDASA